MKLVRVLGRKRRLDFNLVCLPLFSQVNTGRISGAITDQSGGAIAGATVTVTDVARGESRSLTTDGSGLYAAPNLTPGIYTVRAEFKGFETLERQNIQVDVGGDVRVDITLQAPASRRRAITVTVMPRSRSRSSTPPTPKPAKRWKTTLSPICLSSAATSLS